MRFSRFLPAAAAAWLGLASTSSAQLAREMTRPLIDPLSAASPPRSWQARSPAPIVSSRQLSAPRQRGPRVKAPSVRHEYYPTRPRGFSPNRNLAPSFARTRSPIAPRMFFPGPMNGPLPSRLVPLPRSKGKGPRPRAGTAGEAFTR